MTSKYWLLFGSLALGGAQTAACSAKFHSCEETRTCARGGASGKGGAADAGEAGADTDTGGTAGASRGGSAGLDAQAGEAGIAADAGTGGTAGDSNPDTELEVAATTLTAGKTYVPFSGKLSASGAAHYNWSVTSGALPAGLTLQGAQSATVTIAGTPSEAGQFPLSLSVTDGSTTKSVDVTLVITHSALFLSDRNTTGVNELFVAEIGAASPATPVRLNASLPQGGNITSYAWSPDGSKVLYLATQSSGGASELWVASLATPGTAQRVSAVGITVSQTVWLGEGNIAAYSTSAGDTYLADLSAAGPSVSKLAIAGQGNPTFSLQPSPNGRSLVVVGPATSGNYNDSRLVTWASGAATTIPLLLSMPGGQPYFSYDGRFGMIGEGSGAIWADLSSPVPTMHNSLLSHGATLSWSPKAEMLLADTGTSTFDISLFDFTGANLTVTLLAQPLACGQVDIPPWSPDGNNGVFICGFRDVRGISNVSAATVNRDFSLLPSGFLSNAFTNTYDVSWSPNSVWIALRADREVDSQYDLHLIRWSAPGIAYKAHANSIASGVTTWSFAPNSQTVAFVGIIAPQNNAGLYLTKLPASGAPPIATLVSAPASSVVQTDINWLPGSRLITYRATVSGSAQLFALPVASDGTAGIAIPISGVSGTGVSSYQLAPTR